MSSIIIACDSMIDALNAAQESQNTDIEVLWLDRGLHLDPSAMKAELLRTIDGLPAEVDTVMLCLGFCGGVVDQVVAPRRMVIPQVDDCVSMLLHDGVKEHRANMKDPWHLYIYEPTPQDFSIERMMSDVGDPETYRGFTKEQLFQMFFSGYRNVDIIDTGLTDCYSEDYAISAQQMADDISADLDYVSGGITLLENLVSGRWEDGFVVAEPGELIRHGLFFE